MMQGEEQSFRICPLMGAGIVGNSARQEAPAAATQSSKQGCLGLNDQKVTETKKTFWLKNIKKKNHDSYHFVIAQFSQKFLN